MSKISAVILTKNEEAMIADCIDSVSFCDEILIIDSNSSDKTVDIAKRMNAKVYQNATGDFAEKRNFGLQKAKGSWILYVDADERISNHLRESILEEVSNKRNTYAGFIIKTKNFYFGNYEWPTKERLERLFKKDSLKGWYGKLHETPEVDGELGEINGYLLHYTHRDLTSMLQKTISWSETEAKLRYDANHPKMVWWRFPRVMATAFYNSYITQKGYTVGMVGLLESIFQSFSMFITYARLWEMQNKNN